MVAVGRRQQVESLTAIVGAECARVQHIDRIHLFGIGKNVTEIPGALAVTFVFVYPCPGIPRIVGAIQSAFIGFNKRIHPIGVGARHRNADTAQGAFRKAVLPCNCFHVRPAIDGLIESAARSTAVEIPGQPTYLP